MPSRSREIQRDLKRRNLSPRRFASLAAAQLGSPAILKGQPGYATAQFEEEFIIHHASSRQQRP